jgi:hypothetical protein
LCRELLVGALFFFLAVHPEIVQTLKFQKFEKIPLRKVLPMACEPGE